MKSFILMLIVFCIVTRSESGMEPFIVGGEFANIEDFPYAAFLSIHCNAKNEVLASKWICGSSIVNEYITLTAGHCLYGCSKSTSITITAGHTHIKKGTVGTAYGFIVHKHYNEFTVANDIGLIKLKNPLNFGQTVDRVMLMGFPPYGEEALVAGWGVTDKGMDKNSEYLKWTKQYVWEKEKCERVVGPTPEGTFCACNIDSSSYVDVGDSGSALVVNGYIQIGIVSYAAHGGIGVAVYTDTGHFFNWIRRTAEKLMNY